MQIKAKNITHIFDKGMSTEHVAVKNVSAEFKPGEFVTIIGKTGSGKTTFIEHLNALIRPTEGEIIIGDKVIANSKKKIKEIKALRKQVGIVFQFAEYQLFEETILKDIIFGPVTMGMPKEEAIKAAEKYIELVGLDKSYLERSPFALSGGQKRRVALAGILAMEPDYLIFDEPTAGLDPVGEVEMYKIFNRLHKEGKTIIIVTHNLDHVLEHSDRTLMFNDSKLIIDTNSLDLMYDKKFLEANELEEPKLAQLVWDLEAKGKKIGKVRTIAELVKKL